MPKSILFFLILTFGLILGLQSPNAFPANAFSGQDCDSLLRRPRAISFKVNSSSEALHALSESLPLLKTSAQTGVVEDEPWFQLLQHFALPSVRLNSSLLVVTFAGGGNSGKSTLINALPSFIKGDRSYRLNEPISEAGFFPGLTQRMVVAVPPGESPLMKEDLIERFGQLDPWASATEGGFPGAGLKIQIAEIPKNLVFVDSPDFDTGEVRQDLPENLDRALRVVGPSDVLVLLFNPQTVRNLANTKALAKIFKNYGLKHTVMIFWGDPSMPHQEALDLLQQISLSIYDNNPDTARAGVLGSYFMPYSSDVPKGALHPELIPLNSSLTFPELIRQMNSNALSLKKYAIDHASQTIQVEAERTLTTYIKSKMSAEIYRLALNCLIEEVSRDSLEDFPYWTLRDEIRTRFTKLSSKLGQAMQGIASWIAVPENKISQLLQKVNGEQGKFRERLELDHLLRDKLAVSQLVLQLQRRKLTFHRGSHSQDLKKLIKLVKEFAKDFPDEGVSVDLTSSTTLTLPSPEHLSQASQMELQRLFKSDTSQLTQELSTRLNAAQFDSSLSDTSSREIYLSLARIENSQSLLQRGFASTLDFSTLAAPALASYVLANHGINATLVYLAAINLSARPFYKMSDMMKDRFLRTRLDQWFHRLQYRITVSFFKELVTHEFAQSLQQSQVAEKELVALKKSQEAISYLNPKYRVIPFQ